MMQTIKEDRNRYNHGHNNTNELTIEQTQKLRVSCPAYSTHNVNRKAAVTSYVVNRSGE